MTRIGLFLNRFNFNIITLYFEAFALLKRDNRIHRFFFIFHDNNRTLGLRVDLYGSYFTIVTHNIVYLLCWNILGHICDLKCRLWLLETVYWSNFSEEFLPLELKTIKAYSSEYCSFRLQEINYSLSLLTIIDRINHYLLGIKFLRNVLFQILNLILIMR